MNARAYDAYRENKIASGIAYQDHVVRTLYRSQKLIVMQYASPFFQQTVGESCTGIEIKHDELFASTGNLYIEGEEKAHPRPGPYVPAGIYRDDNAWLYVIGNYDVLFAFQVSILRAFYVSGRFRIIENRFGTSRGFLLNQQDARKAAAFVLNTEGTTPVQDGTPIGNLEKLGRILAEEIRRNPDQHRLVF